MANAKIRILFLIDSLAGGGTQQAVLDLSRLLDKNAFEIEIVSLTSAGDRYSDRLRRHAKVTFLQDKKNSVFDYLNPFLWRKLARLIREARPDILHARLNGSLPYASVLCRVLKIKHFIFTIEGSCRQHPKWIAAYYRCFLPNAEFIFTNYPAEYESMGLPVKKLKKYEAGVARPDAIEEPFRHPLKDDSFPVLLSVGRLHRDKGHQYAVQVTRLLKEKFPKARLVILGEGEYRAALEKMIRDFELENHVFLAGHVTEPDWFYTRATFYLNFSVNEPPNLSNLKALLYSAPTVAFATDAESFYRIEEGVSGFTVPIRSARAAADKLAALCGDPSLYASLRQSTGAAMDKNLLYENIAKKYERFYKDTASEHL